jgi:hypothetical protein
MHNAADNLDNPGVFIVSVSPNTHTTQSTQSTQNQQCLQPASNTADLACMPASKKVHGNSVFQFNTRPGDEEFLN